ncbi:lipoprotein [Streptomyces angustmyceticus]|uniref:lipoprotein n=1 Tax=Streptomyces angustmyceticus TaxID=285578 RepID=UPI0033FBE7BE
MHFTPETSWEATALTRATVDRMGPPGHQGPLTPACELDAKAAGHIGFLTVWSGTKGAAAPGGSPPGPGEDVRRRRALREQRQDPRGQGRWPARRRGRLHGHRPGRR